MPARNTLNKNQRLKSRKTIDALFKSGKAFSIFPFRLLYMVGTREPGSAEVTQASLSIENGESSGSGLREKGVSEICIATLSEPLKTGFSAPTKNFKKAVDRNRIKRLTKEAYRLNQQALKETAEKLHITISLFLIYTGKELPDQQLVTEKISVILQLLIKKLHETHPPNS